MTFHEVLLTLVAVAAVGIALFGIFLTNKRTKESIGLTRKELSVRLSPWIGRDAIPDSI